MLQCVSRALVARRPDTKADISRFVSHALGPVENQDSTFGLVVIQALDGTIRADGRPMGEDGAALFGEANGPRTQRKRQPPLRRGGTLDRADGKPVA